MQPKIQHDKKILILHTGGTFGMDFNLNHESYTGDSRHFLNGLLTQVPELSTLAHINLSVLCNIDSSDATPEHWILIAKTICESWHQYDGFVVIHGTDTMAWTAAAIAYFLQGLTKSVVFTGSQRPLTSQRNDARANIIDSVELAAYGIPQVMVCFDSKVHKATRVTKYSNEHLHAFRSYNSPLIGRFGVKFTVDKRIVKSIVSPERRHAPELKIDLSSNIISLMCVPGVTMPPQFIESVLQSCEGIIVQGFGSGNLPLENPSWQSLCRQAQAKQIPVVMVSQCDSGEVNLSLYKNGRAYAGLGVMTGLDMTFEALSVKLMVMLGRKIPFEKRHEFFSEPLAYECATGQSISE